LGVEPTQVKILDGALRQYREEGASPSYPGLITRYLIHIVEVEIEGLPDKDFATQEGSRAGGETIKKHHWSWKPFDEDRPSRI
jgi:hypothetical protein